MHEAPAETRCGVRSLSLTFGTKVSDSPDWCQHIRRKGFLMGEYAKYKGEEIKIGTCEDMYYLRYDQAALVRPKRGNTDPVRDRADLRFRFPFPDEDSIEPGQFRDPFRSVRINAPMDWEGIAHNTIQFRNERGLLVNLPCPEGTDNPHNIMKNGYPGNIGIKQQRWVNDQLVVVCECGSCGALFRIPTLEQASQLIESLRARAIRDSEPESGFFTLIADRIEAGYLQSVAVSA